MVGNGQRFDTFAICEPRKRGCPKTLELENENRSERVFGSLSVIGLHQQQQSPAASRKNHRGRPA